MTQEEIEQWYLTKDGYTKESDMPEYLRARLFSDYYQERARRFLQADDQRDR